MKNLRILMGGILLLGLAQPCRAASFDCARAQSKIERLVCADAAISHLDDTLSAAFQRALLRTGNSRSLKDDQVRWIKNRNACQTSECVTEAYRARIEVLDSEADTRKRIGKWTHRYEEEREIPLCRALVQRLNRYTRDEEHCATVVLASYPEFKVPDWQEVDRGAYEHLATEILRVGPQGVATVPAPTRSGNSKAFQPDSSYGYNAEQALKTGARVRVWRTRAFDQYWFSGVITDAPPGLQAIVQLDAGDDARADGSYCKGKPFAKERFPSWVQNVIFEPDLRRADPRVDPSTFNDILGSVPMLYQGTPVFIYGASISRGAPGRLQGVCSFLFVEGGK